METSIQKLQKIYHKDLNNIQYQLILYTQFICYFVAKNIIVSGY